MSLSGFVTTLIIMGAVSLIVIVLTIVSISRNSSKLTSFEKKLLIFVAVFLCGGMMFLFIISNFAHFKALL